MATKPKKSSKVKKVDPQANANGTTEQHAPAVPPMPQFPNQETTPPSVGSSVMALSPAVNGQWQMSRVVANPSEPSRPLVEFPDGTMYLYDNVQISAPIAPQPQTAPNPANPSHIDLIGTLKPSYQQFREDVIRANIAAQEMFQLPLDAVLTMARRNAFQQQIDSNGRMDTIGNEGQFIPDFATFERWMTSYLEEIQRREQTAGTAAQQ